jgi:hypothetical protein
MRRFAEMPGKESSPSATYTCERKPQSGTGLVAGSPKAGDTIARNPKNHADKWLVAAQYFADNFEPSSLPRA